MEIICTYTQAHVLAGGYVGRERACDSATGGPIYGNHLHMSWQGGMGPERACDNATGMGVYGAGEGLRQCDRWAQIWKSSAHAPRPMLWHGGIWGLREPATVRQVCPNMEIICIYTQSCVLAWVYGA